VRSEIDGQARQQTAITLQQAVGEGRILPADGLQHFTDGFPAGHHLFVAGRIAAEGGRDMNSDDGSFAEHDAPPFGWCP